MTTLAVTDHRFGLVNFDLDGTVGVTIPWPGVTHHTRGLPVTLTVGDRTIKGVNGRYRRCGPRRCRERSRRGAVSDAGTKVVWIYRHDFSGDQIVHTTHRSSIVKA